MIRRRITANDAARKRRRSPKSANTAARLVNRVTANDAVRKRCRAIVHVNAAAVLRHVVVNSAVRKRRIAIISVNTAAVAVVKRRVPANNAIRKRRIAEISVNTAAMAVCIPAGNRQTDQRDRIFFRSAFHVEDAGLFVGVDRYARGLRRRVVKRARVDGNSFRNRQFRS